jgi:nucleolar protein 56
VKLSSARSRIEFYASGAPPAKNAAVMQAAMNSVLADIGVEDPTATAAEDVEMADGITAAATEQAVRKEKKEKKDKKDKKKDKKKSKATEEEVKPSKKESKRKHADDEEDGEGKKKKKKSKA